MPSSSIAPNRLTDTLMHLLSMPTITTDQATSRAALDWIQEQLKDLPLEFKRFTHKGYDSLVATTTGTKDPRNPKLWLAGHIDVVSASPEAFKPAIRDGRIYGRGAHDMKFAIAIFITLLQELGDKLVDYDLGLMISSDEELGGFQGVMQLIETHGYRGGVAIVPDCSADWELEMGSKGISWWNLTATGSTTHGSRPWEGVNAIDEMVRFITELRTYFTPEPCGDPGHQHHTLNFATIVAQNSTNSVPDKAVTSIDIRHTPEIDVEVIRGWLTETQIKIPNVTSEQDYTDNPYRAVHSAELEHFKRVAKEITGYTLKERISHGSADARFFARQNIPTINICPTGSGYHMPEEWMNIAEMEKFYAVIARFTDEIATS